MGAFNILVIEAACSSCGVAIDLRIQFKFGDTWQHEYRLGDKLKWNGNDIGLPNLRRIAIEGVSEDCPNCGHDSDFEIELQADEIVAARAVSVSRFLDVAEDYILLTPEQKSS